MGKAVGHVHLRHWCIKWSVALTYYQHHPSIFCEFHMKQASSFMPTIFLSLCLHYFLTEKLMLVLFVQQPRMRANLTACVTTTVCNGIIKERDRSKGWTSKIAGWEKERGKNTDHYALKQCEKRGAKKFLETGGKSRVWFWFCRGLCEIPGNGHDGYLPLSPPCTLIRAKLCVALHTQYVPNIVLV